MKARADITVSLSKWTVLGTQEPMLTQDQRARSDTLSQWLLCAGALAGIVASWIVLFLAGTGCGLLATAVVVTTVGIIVRRRWVWPLLFEAPVCLSLLVMVAFCLIRYLLR